MTIIMQIAMKSDVAPMPEPIPVALAELFLNSLPGITTVSSTALTLTGMVAHFSYGALAGSAYAILFTDRTSWKTGLLWGVILWGIMQMLFLPMIGWGMFGTGVTGFPPKIAVGTLILHLVYGAILGWGV
jgi:uncharacterized membrane protein YagU involved in acid resistance